MKITPKFRENEIEFERTIWDLAQLSPQKIAFLIATYIMIVIYIIYVPVLKNDRESTWAFFHNILKIETIISECIAYTIFYFVPVGLPLIWGVIERQNFEVLKGNHAAGGCAFVLVFYAFKLAVIYFTGIVAVVVNTIKLIIYAVNRKVTQKNYEKSLEMLCKYNCLHNMAEQASNEQTNTDMIDSSDEKCCSATE